MTYPTDHAGLEVLPFDMCLGLLASVPVGRIGFFADGELAILPVNHLVDGQDVVFRTAAGSKLSAAENGDLVVFEADSYDDLDRSGWSVVVNGFAEVIGDNAETGRLSSLGLHPWSTAVEHPLWIRIRPVSVSGRRTPGALAVAHDTDSRPAVRGVPGNTPGGVRGGPTASQAAPAAMSSAAVTNSAAR